MSRIKSMLMRNHNSLVNSDISKMSALEVLVVKAVSSNDPAKLHSLMGIEDYMISIDPNYNKPCPVVENIESEKAALRIIEVIEQAGFMKKKPKKTDK